MRMVTSASLAKQKHHDRDNTSMLNGHDQQAPARVIFAPIDNVH